MIDTKIVATVPIMAKLLLIPNDELLLAVSVSTSTSREAESSNRADDTTGSVGLSVVGAAVGSTLTVG